MSETITATDNVKEDTMTRSRWVAFGMIAAAAIGTVGTAASFALDSAPGVPTAEEVYSADMSLREISERSQGTPGRVAPPCPDEAHVEELKTAGLPVGPCDPFPEEESPLLVPEDGPANVDGGPDEELCVVITGRDPAHQVNLPCAPGVKTLETKELQLGGETCVEVTYIPSAGSAKRTETLCPSSPRSPGGATMGQRSHEHVPADGSGASAP